MFAVSSSPTMILNNTVLANLSSGTESGIIVDSVLPSGTVTTSATELHECQLPFRPESLHRDVRLAFAHVSDEGGTVY
jgi:hypothetical protein